MQPSSKHNFEVVEQHTFTVDPIDAIGRNYDDTERVGLLKKDIARIDDILASDTTLTSLERTDLYDMGINLRLDWLYSEHGGRSLQLNDFLPAVKEAENFAKAAADHTYKQHNKHPQDFWAVQTKLLDLRAYEAHRFAQDSQTTLKGTEQGRKLFGFSEDIMRSVVADSIRLMSDMEKHSAGPSGQAQRARGMLYEQMIIAYAREKSYEDQDFDTVFVRSALKREDEPHNGYAYPKRAFDIVIVGEDKTRLLQAKNHDNDEDYAYPIEKIEDEHFGSTLTDLPRHLANLKVLISNSSDPTFEGRMHRARVELDKAFGERLAQAA